MATSGEKTQKLDPLVIGTRDVVFECPSCGKNLVVDEAAQGMIVDCPQCHSNVIVPPKGAAASAPAQAARSAAALEEKLDEPSTAGFSELAALHERLATLGGQLRELQTQRTEINNRLASRVNEINRDLVMMARLETSHQQIMSEWNQIVSQIAAYSSQTIVVGASARSTGRSRVQFGS